MSDTSILGLQRTNLRDQAAVALRGAIVSGELSPGTHVSEVEMAARLQISRGTLREAIRTLQNEGLLTPGPRGRLLVRRMTDQQVRELFQVRAALEALAARALTESPEREHAVAELRAAADRLAADRTPEIADRMSADMDFHRQMCRLTGNETLVRAWEALESTILMSITNAGTERGVTNMSVDHHQMIVDAIASGDTSRAVSTVESHMLRAVGNLID